MSITSFRQAISAQLEESLQIKIVDGAVTGPQRRRDVGGIWSPGVEEDPLDVLEEFIHLRVRIFLRMPGGRGHSGELPSDPAPLEQLAESIQSTLAPFQSAHFDVDYFRVTAVTINVDEWGVDAVIIGRHSNPFADI